MNKPGRHIMLDNLAAGIKTRTFTEDQYIRSSWKMNFAAIEKFWEQAKIAARERPDKSLSECGNEILQELRRLGVRQGFIV